MRENPDEFPCSTKGFHDNYPTLLGLQYVDIVKCLYSYPLKNTLAAPETEKWIRFNA